MIFSKIKKMPVIWFVFLITNVLEFYFFRSYLSKNIEFFYPTYTDQCNYLPLSYGLFENIKQFGWIAGIKQSPGLATGFLFPIQPVFLYMIFGASRFTALLFNFIYFVLLQFFSLIAVRSISNKIYFSFLFLAFVFAANVPFWVAGGLMDFRIDFIAFCLYGIVLGCVVKSKLLFDIKWTVITAIFATLLICLRFITAVYLLSIFITMLIYLTAIIHASVKSSCDSLVNKVRLKNLLVLVLYLTAIVGCYISLNSDVLYNYYWGGHFLGAEKLIRAKEVGVSNALSSILYYPHSVIFEQLTKFWVIILFLSLILTLIPIKYNKISRSVVFDKAIPWKGMAFMILLFLFVPLTILTMDPSKSPVVGSIMVVPVIWCIMWCYLYLDSKLGENKSAIKIVTWGAVLLFIISFSHHLIKLNVHKKDSEYSELKTITQMYLDIGDYAEAMKWPKIYLSVDQSCDFLVHGGIRTIYYEIRGKLLPLANEGLGVSIFPVTKEDVIQKLQKSNVLVINTKPYPGTSTLPFNQAMSTFRPLLKKYAALHFKSLGYYQFKSTTYQVFMK